MTTKKRLTVTVHAGDVARLLVRDNGLTLVTRKFNEFRLANGKTKRDRAPVKPATVKRYTGHGSGYEVAPPALFCRFVLARVAKKW